MIKYVRPIVKRHPRKDVNLGIKMKPKRVPQQRPFEPELYYDEETGETYELIDGYWYLVEWVD